MRDRNKFTHIVVVMLLLFLTYSGIFVQGQDQKPMTIQATARGTGTQSSKMFNVNVYIETFSTQDDRRTLIDAFMRSGQDGLVNALSQMKGKGRFSTPYGVGNEIKYIIELPPENGRRHIRLITDRRIAFGEAYFSTRSEEYSVGAIELFLTADGKKSEGIALPACRLSLDKKKQQLEIETYQNPWKLVNLLINK